MTAPDPPALSRSTVDRAAHRRADEVWLERAWADPASRVLVINNGQTLQPWPFLASLMLGFTCRAVDPAAPLHLQADEIADARWLTRAELAADAVLLPPPVSIAHRLITTWASGGWQLV